MRDATHENIPFSYSGKNYTFEKTEISILTNIRKWALQYFNQYNVISSDMYTPLSKVQELKEEFDMVAKITQIYELDEYTNELRLRDHTDHSWNVLALKVKFPHLKVGDAIRVRSARFEETTISKRVVLLSHYSNIMTFVSTSKLSKDFKDKVTDEEVDRQSLAKQEMLMSPVKVTEVDKKHA